MDTTTKQRGANISFCDVTIFVVNVLTASCSTVTFLWNQNFLISIFLTEYMKSKIVCFSEITKILSARRFEIWNSIRPKLNKNLIWMTVKKVLQINVIMYYNNSNKILQYIYGFKKHNKKWDHSILYGMAENCRNTCWFTRASFLYYT
jgi:hypothetical protein